MGIWEEHEREMEELRAAGEAAKPPTPEELRRNEEEPPDPEEVKAQLRAHKIRRAMEDPENAMAPVPERKRRPGDESTVWVTIFQTFGWLIFIGSCVVSCADSESIIGAINKANATIAGLLFGAMFILVGAIAREAILIRRKL